MYFEFLPLLAYVVLGQSKGLLGAARVLKATAMRQQSPILMSRLHKLFERFPNVRALLPLRRALPTFGLP